MVRIFVLIFCLVFVIKCSFIYSPNNTEVEIKTPILELKNGINPPYNITANIWPVGRSMKELSICYVNEQLEKFIKGSVVVITISDNCTNIDQVIELQRVGVKAVLILSDLAWVMGRLIQEVPEDGEIKIPILFISSKDFFELIIPVIRNNNTVQIKLEATPNEMDSLNKGGIIFLQIMVAVTNLTALVLGCIKLTRFILLDGFYPTLPKLVYICSICSSILCFMFNIDPFGFHRVITSWNYFVIYFLVDIFENMLYLLISIHFTMILMHIKILPDIVFHILIFVFAALICTVIGINGANMHFHLKYRIGDVITTTLSSIEAAIFSLIILLFISGGIFLYLLTRNFINLKSQQSEKRKIEYNRIMICILLLGIVGIIICLFYGLQVNRKMSVKPSGFLSFNEIQAFFFGLAGIIVFFMYSNPKNQVASGPRSKSGTGSEMSVSNKSEHTKFKDSVN
eukprot:TRINITY_DN4290_c0_g2_i1.p1 TRINITY_DN4290_c0_g2~~TRINITY_DN4290_c0_g2_i1.p1  ORF type:complete len:456 (+),score=89.11 TRINITY_DN4290_c0_g2_i1:387-1754(+)